MPSRVAIISPTGPYPTTATSVVSIVWSAKSVTFCPYEAILLHGMPAAELTHQTKQVWDAPVLHDLAVADPEEATGRPGNMLAAGRQPHKRPVLGALAFDESRHHIILGDHVNDVEMHVGEAGAEHGEHGFDPAQAPRRARRR